MGPEDKMGTQGQWKVSEESDPACLQEVILSRCGAEVRALRGRTCSP